MGADRGGGDRERGGRLPIDHPWGSKAMQALLRWIGPPEPLMLAAIGTLAAVPLLRRWGGGLGRRGTGAAVGVGLLLALWYLIGGQLVTPRLLVERLPYLVAVAFLLGAMLDATQAPRWLVWLAVVLGALAGGWWLIGAPREFPDPWAFVRRLVVPAAILAASIGGLARAGGDARAPAAMLLAAAAGLLVAAGLAGVPTLYLVLAAAIVAAALPFFLVHWLRPGFVFGAAGAFAGGAALGGTASVMWTATRADGLAPALVALGCVFLVAPLAERVGPRGRGLRTAAMPLLWLAAAALPAAAAVLLAWLLGPGG